MATSVRQENIEKADRGVHSPASEVLLLSADQKLLSAIAEEIVLRGLSFVCNAASPDQLALSGVSSRSIIVYLASARRDAPLLPDLGEAEEVCRLVSERGVSSFILGSSAAVYGASYRNPGLLDESNPLPKTKRKSAYQWRLLERLAERYWDLAHNLTILRCATILSTGYANLLSRYFKSGIALVQAGHDPTIQLLSAADLGRAIACVLERGVKGIVNVAPDQSIPLKEALRRAGIRSLALPHSLLRSAGALSRAEFEDHLDFTRYSWTVSNQRLSDAGFRASSSSLEALFEFRRSLDGAASDSPDPQPPHFDSFGMDKSYIHFYGKTLLRFLCDYYWRIEHKGLEHIPGEGRALLVGMHRGFMPFDGVMALHLLVQKTGRYPRFLVHPGLLKFPFLANFMTKLGGIIASQENADRVLGEDELVGIFPEGIHGAFTAYRHAYQLQDFGRDAFVKIALRNRSPIVPFVTVGSAEIFPILAKIHSRHWTRYSEWPSIPLTPTFPLVPVPLPSKWHTQFLPPIHTEDQYPPDAYRNPSLVKAISVEVRTRMQNAVNDMLVRRRSIFFGSIFEPETGG